MATVADSAVAKIRQLLDLFERDRREVAGTRGGSIYVRAALQMNVIIREHLRGRIAIRIPETAVACNTTKPTVARALQDLEELGIAKEVTGKPRNRVYVYQQYLDILNRDAAEHLSALFTSSTQIFSGRSCSETQARPLSKILVTWFASAVFVSSTGATS